MTLLERLAIRAPLSERTDRELLVDVSVIARHDARTGIQRVVRAIWLHLPDLLPEGIRLRPVYAGKWQRYSYAPLDFLECGLPDKPRRPDRISPQSGDIFLGLDLAAHLIPRHEKQISKWRKCGVSINFFVYDLLPFTHPEWFNANMCRNFARWLQTVSRQADQAVCISAHVAGEFKRWMDAQDVEHSFRPVTTVMHLGADIDASGPSGGVPASALSIIDKIAKQDSVLMVGTIEPRKGYDDVLAAFEHLWQQDDNAPALVIVGRPGWKTEDLQQRLRAHVENGRRLFWLQDASDEMLNGLFAVSKGLISASRAEGFGLPLIEAVRSGLPVLARDLPVFRELALPNVHFFENAESSLLGAEIAMLVKRQPEDIENVRLAGWREVTDNLLRVLAIKADASPFFNGSGK